jgi:hypothetical protein
MEAAVREKSPGAEVEVRKDFPETWLWEDYRNVK